MLSIFGPGDEIRFASIYNLLKKYYSFNNIIIACEPRLYDLCCRSFPQLQFVSVKRLRHNQSFDLKDYNKLPGF